MMRPLIFGIAFLHGITVLQCVAPPGTQTTALTADSVLTSKSNVLSVEDTTATTHEDREVSPQDLVRTKGRVVVQADGTLVEDLDKLSSDFVLSADRMKTRIAVDASGHLSRDVLGAESEGTDSDDEDGDAAGRLVRKGLESEEGDEGDALKDGDAQRPSVEVKESSAVDHHKEADNKLTVTDTRHHYMLDALVGANGAANRSSDEVEAKLSGDHQKEAEKKTPWLHYVLCAIVVACFILFAVFLVRRFRSGGRRSPHMLPSDSPLLRDDEATNRDVQVRKTVTLTVPLDGDAAGGTRIGTPRGGDEDTPLNRAKSALARNSFRLSPRQASDGS